MMFPSDKFQVHGVQAFTMPAFTTAADREVNFEFTLGFTALVTFDRFEKISVVNQSGLSKNVSRVMADFAGIFRISGVRKSPGLGETLRNLGSALGTGPKHSTK